MSATILTDKLLGEITEKAREIHTDAYPMSIGELITIYRDGELDIHPEFQRFFRCGILGTLLKC